MPFLIIVACSIVGLDLHTAFVTRRRNRRTFFQMAAHRAKELGVPLLVVGDPDTGFVTQFFGRDYGCGNLCTDLTGCPSCPSGIVGPLEEVLPQLPDRSHVIYVSCTLEYVTDLPGVIQQLERVAVPGGLFVVRVEHPHSTWDLYPGAKWILHSAPPTGDWIFTRYAGQSRRINP